MCAAEYNEATGKNEILEEWKSSSVKLKQTFYESNNPEWDPKGYDWLSHSLLLGNTPSWLASLCIDNSTYDEPGYMVFLASGDEITAWELLDSNWYGVSGCFGVRPLITLSSFDIEIDNIPN